jgi:hypothetical protein
VTEVSIWKWLVDSFSFKKTKQNWRLNRILLGFRNKEMKPDGISQALC